MKEVAGYIIPAPSGVGPMTITMLVTNMVRAAEGLSGFSKLFHF
jgi:methylenetetrahydrofolate dehydrogenase (NADP+) / methenyltetrahydrofolate cyclohydrolase